MKSEGNQVDWVQRHRQVQAYRASAEASMTQPYFSERERQERADYYRNQAERLEAEL